MNFLMGLQFLLSSLWLKTFTSSFEVTTIMMSFRMWSRKAGNRQACFLKIAKFEISVLFVVWVGIVRVFDFC